MKIAEIDNQTLSTYMYGMFNVKKWNDLTTADKAELLAQLKKDIKVKK